MGSHHTDDLFEDWLLFQNIIARNYLQHREIIGVLQRWLHKRDQRGIRVLDLGCGDSYVARRSFLGNDAVQYYGIDHSQQALDVARSNFKGYSWSVELPCGDFTRLIQQLHGPFDLVIAGYSFHNLEQEDKASAMDNIRLILSPTGTFMVYDLLPNQGEQQAVYKERLMAHAEANWTLLDRTQIDAVRAHLTTQCNPIDQSAWRQLAYDSGLGSGELIYRDSAELVGMLEFSE
ncbi:hypothetical protein NT6N_27900 [Oceaniferula spumae]|uniref:Methyltransferase domain-containing protein n=1 Tax=Oceaniferula spumae TaxID=2979115 RepID=A0AAT9FP05_9BACT